MPPTGLIILGNPKAGTPLMVATPTAAIDLPSQDPCVARRRGACLGGVQRNGVFAEPARVCGGTAQEHRRLGRPGAGGSRPRSVTGSRMGPDDLLTRDFAAVPELLRAHALIRPRQAALIHDGRSIDYAALDRRADRIAAALQRDHVRARDTIAIGAATGIDYVAIFLGSLRAGAAVAPLPVTVDARHLAGMVADADARILFLDRPTAHALASIGAIRRGAAPHPRGRPRSLELGSLDDAGGFASRGRRIQARLAIQCHLFLWHDGRAQGHRAAACVPLVQCAARPHDRLRPRVRDTAGNALVFQYHSGHVVRRAGPGRRHRA